MINLILIIILILISVFYLFPFFLLKLGNKDNINSFNYFLNTNIKKPFFFNNSEDYLKANKNIIFVPHPFTNWSLNPNYKNKNGENEHTYEGFKKTTNSNSVLNLISKNKYDFKIICIGGSSTHCQEMKTFDLTWPSRLNTKLNNYDDNNILVINFGVGAWNTLQSYIRCITWFPSIKPDLLVFYHSKNDLTPINNGNELESNIMPDYQNVMIQYSSVFVNEFFKLFFKIPLLKYIFYKKYYDNNFSQYGMNAIYNNPKSVGLERLDDNLLNSIEERHAQIINLCKFYNTNVLYIPEIVLDKLYSEKLEILNKKLKNNFINNNIVEWFDVRNILKNQKDIFLDKMHFSKKGNEVFSNILAEKIKNKYLDLIKNEK